MFSLIFFSRQKTTVNMADWAGMMARLCGVRGQTHAEGEMASAGCKADDRHIDCGQSVQVTRGEDTDFINAFKFILLFIF